MKHSLPAELVSAEVIAVAPLTPSASAEDFPPLVRVFVDAVAKDVRLRREVVQSMIAKAQSLSVDFDVIVGTSSSLSLASLFAARTATPLCYVRLSAKRHGKSNRIEGALEEGHRALILADCLPKPDFLASLTEALREKGATAVACLCLYSRSPHEQAKLALEAELAIDSVVTTQDLLAQGSLPQPDKEVLREWAFEPERWATRNAERLEADRSRAQAISQILLDLRAVTLSPHKPYTFASGVLSPIYTDNRLLASHPERWRVVITAMAELVKTHIGLHRVDALAGVVTSGIPHAAYLSEVLDLPMSPISPNAQPGTPTLSHLRGKRVLVVEDLISTGASSLNVIRALRATGAVVADCLAIFNYGMQAACSSYDNDEVRLWQLASLSDLVTAAVASGLLDPQLAAIIHDWVDHPHSWVPPPSE